VATAVSVTELPMQIALLAGDTPTLVLMSVNLVTATAKFGLGVPLIGTFGFMLPNITPVTEYAKQERCC